jgi:hypothetical protein
MVKDIERLEDEMQGLEGSRKMTNTDPELTHIFVPGLYCREIFMPAGDIITSKVHKTEHVFIISKGKCSVSTKDGNEILEAPHTGITYPGTKRALYIIEDTIWTTMHPTELTDIDEIEAEIISQTYDEYLLYKEEQLLLENNE